MICLFLEPSLTGFVVSLANGFSTGTGRWPVAVELLDAEGKNVRNFSREDQKKIAIIFLVEPCGIYVFYL